MENILFALIATFFYIYPIALVATNKREQGNKKTAWILATIFLSWFAYIAFVLTVPKKKRSH